MRVNCRVTIRFKEIKVNQQALTKFSKSSYFTFQMEEKYRESVLPEFNQD